MDVRRALYSSIASRDAKSVVAREILACCWVQRALRLSPPFAGEPIVAGIVALIAQRSALAVRRLTEGESDIQDEVGES
ncbi:MAG: hypothetical protein ACKOD9_01305 [Rubrivivax sp.]